MHEPHHKESFVGLLLLKKVRILMSYPTVLIESQLLTYDPDDGKKVSDFPLSILPEAEVGINCFQALDYLCVSKPCFLFL